MNQRGHYRSKTLATWMALVGGGLGLHRLYLHGWRRPLGLAASRRRRCSAWPALQRMRKFGQDDKVSWVLIPLLGLMLAQAAMLARSSTA